MLPVTLFSFTKMFREKKNFTRVVSKADNNVPSGQCCSIIFFRFNIYIKAAYD